MDDLPLLQAADRAADMRATFKANLSRHETVISALVATFWQPYLMAGLCKLPHDCCVFAGPLLLRRLIRLIESEAPQVTDAVLTVGGIGLAGLVQTVCLQQYFHRVYRVQYNCMAALNATIYEKALLATSAARTANPIGQTVNLISVGMHHAPCTCTCTCTRPST